MLLAQCLEYGRFRIVFVEYSEVTITSAKLEKSVLGERDLELEVSCFGGDLITGTSGPNLVVTHFLLIVVLEHSYTCLFP